MPAFSILSFPGSAAAERWLIGVGPSEAELAWGAVAESSRSRIVPWKRIVRFRRFGRGLSPRQRDAAFDAIVEFAARSHALRVHVSIYEPDELSRHALIDGLAARGFTPAVHRQAYTDTVLIDLRQSEEALLQSFHAKTRRDIRALEKAGLSCRAITDPSYSVRMNELLGISMARTGGRFTAVGWDEILAFISREPSRAALLGVFRSDLAGPEALVGYVLGYRHGDTIEYGVAACARLSDIKAPLLYAPTWELMRWGRRHGGEWFDFGGVTGGTRTAGDRAGGISEFKRYFRSDVTVVGEEMVYSPSPWLSRAAAGVSAASSFLGDHLAGLSRQASGHVAAR